MRLHFTGKLVAGTLALIALVVLALSIIQYRQASRGLTALGEAALENTVEDLRKALELHHATLLQEMNLAVNVLEMHVDDNGGFSMAGTGMSTRRTVRDQTTMQPEQLAVPPLTIGGSPLYGQTAFVDEFADKTGAAATIFQVLPGKLLRVSTTITTEDGQRAIGTYIPSSSPVYQTVMRGETYTGKATVVGQDYLTAYKPLMGPDNRPVAVLFVGEKILTPDLRQLIEGKTLSGRGYTYVYTPEGRLLVHPTIEGKLLAEAAPDFWQQTQGVENGLVKYDFKGQEKFAQIASFEPWGWRLGMGIGAEEVMLGTDDAILTSALTVGLAGLALAGVATMLLLRRLLRPIYRLTEMTEEVAKGNLDAHYDYDAPDVIGRAVSSVNAMVAEIKNKLGFSQGILSGMTVSCVVTDTEGKVSFVNQPCLDFLEHDGRPEDYVGQDVSQFFYGEKGRETITGKAMDQRSAITGVQAEVSTRKGNTRFTQIDAAPLLDLDGTLIGGFGLFSDLTEIKQQQRLIEKKNQTINEAAQKAADISTQVASASEELSAQIEQSSQGSDEQQRRTSETATAIEQMNASVLEVARNASSAAELADSARKLAQDGSSVVERVVADIRGVQAKAEELQTDMGELGGHAEEIGRVVEVISDIADQTNLLALNAAIEAARAGEAGRGFAVVADEVRKLAEKTMSATGEVGKVIAAIQQSTQKNIDTTRQTVESIEEATQLAGESGTALTEIVGIVENTADQVRAIATASEEQSAASEQITNSAGEVNRIASETADAMVQSAQAVSDLASLAQNLNTVMDDLRQE